jgi:hypothetical protein
MQGLVNRGYWILILEEWMPPGPRSQRKDNGKRPMPMLKNGFHDASNDLDVVWGWARLAPYCNLGISCRESGIDAIDIDVYRWEDEDWVKAYGASLDEVLALLREHGLRLPSTRTTATASGGFHRLHRARAEGRLQQRTKVVEVVGELPSLGLAKISLDTRGDAGYVLAPGSCIDGRYYETLLDVDEAPIDLGDLWALGGAPAGEEADEAYPDLGWESEAPPGPDEPGTPDPLPAPTAYTPQLWDTEGPGAGAGPPMGEKVA